MRQHTEPSISSGPVRAFLEQAERQGVGVLVSEPLDAANICRFANLAAAEILDQGAEELIGATLGTEKIAGGTFVADALQRRPPEQVLEVTGELRLTSGRRHRLVWSRVACLVQGRPLTVHLLRRSERNAGDSAALLDDELRFRRLMDVAPDGVFVFCGERLVYANQAMTQLHGYSNPRQLLQLGLEHLIHEDDREFVRQALSRILEPPFEPKLLTLRIVRRDGSALPIEAYGLRIEWDEVPAVLVTSRDLSGRRLVQSRLAHTDRLAAVGTMAAGVAHEINNPLAYVLLNLEYLLREVPKLEHHYERTGHLLDRLREARHGAERVAAIVGDLRTFSRANEERLGPVDLRQVLSGAILVAQSQLGERGRIIEEYEEIPRATGNASRLEQVFLNLLINAIQALPSDRADDNRICVRTCADGSADNDSVVVEIADTGAGIAPELLNRVFDPFFTTKPVGMGTGLGLPICHSIVTQMGGGIRVESELGRGTSFFVTLAVARAFPTESTLPPAESVICWSRRAKILVIDDEPAVATTLSRLLGEEHDVVVATSGQAALECFEEQFFDVVLCDLLMPEMSGMELHGELCRRLPRQAERMAFMSGGAFTPRAAQFLSNVQNPRLEKPFDLRAVRGLVEEITERFKCACGTPAQCQRDA